MTHFARPFIYLMIGSTLFLSACGVKGDLFLPNQKSMTDNITNESQ
jgi:predicted small lipoprotein YifL